MRHGLIMSLREPIKLNKIVREILATYCPFPKRLRERQISKQPIFEEAYADV